MGSSRATLSRAALLLAGCLVAPLSRAANPPGSPTVADAAPAYKSVYGTFESVSKTRNSIAMKSDEGKRVEWRMDPRVLAETGDVKPGDRMIVIYRQISTNEKRVTAVAFPGSAKNPTYVNTTGERVSVRSSPAVNGGCDTPSPDRVDESVIPVGGRAEIAEGCWCCSTVGESCTPGNQTGAGRALLVSCFK